MPAKRNKSNVSFKIFSNDNHSKFASRFPFLKERQIKAKLHQAWKNQFDSAAEDRKRFPKNKHRNEALFTEVKLEENDRHEENKLENSPLKTYSDKCHSHKRKAQEHQATSTACESQSSKSSVCISASNLDAKKGSKESSLNSKSKENELIDLFEEISAEQLLIEPLEIDPEDRELGSKEPGSFNHKKWLEKLSQNAQQEKISSQNTGTVSGMFKWRADGKTNSQQNKDELSSESRFLESNECEGDSNFLTMFDGKEDIFL